MTQDPAITELTDALADAVASGSMVSFTISKPTPTAGDLKSIDIRPVMIKRALKLSFTYHHRTRDIVKNYPPHEALPMIAMQLTEHFSQAKLLTTQADFYLSRGNGHSTFKRHAATCNQAPELSHDRAKQRLIGSEGKPYLHALGITDAKGTVYKNAQDKFRQINKYIEILDGLIEPLPLQKLRIVDMGAGKGYLTFALYDHLSQTLKREVEIAGVEVRPELVKQCNDIAQAAGFKELRFVEGSIGKYDCAGADIVIALHACDTATDDAIANAVRANAALIVVAPCCQKQIRREMDKHSADHPLQFLIKYGTYVERIAEMVTDGMRAELLELNGYRANLFEFISDAHTPKNVMIVGTKTKQELTATEAERRRATLARTKAQFGISHHRLEQLLAE